MYPLTVQEICELTDATIHGAVKPTAVIDGCVIDSRNVQHGDAFFALKGTQQHGVTFATAAVRDGADVVIVDEEQSASCQTPHITVPDAEIALAQIAHHNRRRSDALVVGVTGSVGKTTTRRMIASVLETVHSGIQSPRNFNNHLGVPLSLMELQDGDEFAVIEIAASAPGEIQVLSAVTEPDFAVVTRVAPAHLGGLGTIQAVQQAKQELVLSLRSDGTAFLNIDDPLVAQMQQNCRGRVVTFGLSDEADVRATEVEPLDDVLRIVVDNSEYRVPVCGRHNATNALAAIAVGLEIGVSPEQINEGLRHFEAPDGRCTITNIGPWKVIDDTYNANPASVTAAIKTAEDYRDCHHRVLVLSDMLDLGEQAADLHYGIGAALASSSIDHIAITGNFAADVVEGFLTSGGKLNRISMFNDQHLLLNMLNCLLSDDDLLLVKGSRATHMENILANLRPDQADGLWHDKAA